MRDVERMKQRCSGASFSSVGLIEEINEQTNQMLKFTAGFGIVWHSVESTRTVPPNPVAL